LLVEVLLARPSDRAAQQSFKQTIDLLRDVRPGGGLRKALQKGRFERPRHEAAGGSTSGAAFVLPPLSQGGVTFAGMTSLSKVTWSLAHDGGDTYRLTNTGDAQAVGVAVSAHESLSLIERYGGPDFGPGEALTFMAATDMGTKDTTITVTWHEPSDRDPDKQWRYPLPGR
jgi:hypothetical protein